MLDASKLAPGVGDLTKIFVERYKAKTKRRDLPPHASMGFNNTWIFLEQRAAGRGEVRRHDAEALRKAALDVDIPLGGTIQGYGVKFNPPEDAMAGQNLRALPVVMQYRGRQITVSGRATIGPGAGAAAAARAPTR